MRLPPRALPELECYLVHKRLEPALTATPEACQTLEEELYLPGLAFHRDLRPVAEVGPRDRDGEGC